MEEPMVYLEHQTSNYDQTSVSIETSKEANQNKNCETLILSQDDSFQR